MRDGEARTSASKGRLSRKLRDKRLRGPNYAPQMKRTARVTLLAETHLTS
jgi:hypothetical protein